MNCLAYRHCIHCNDAYCLGKWNFLSTCSNKSKFGVATSWSCASTGQTGNIWAQCKWNGLSVPHCSRHLLCRHLDNPRHKRLSCQSDNHLTLHSLPPLLLPHRLQGLKANTVTNADPGPAHSFTSGLMWQSVSWLSIWINKGPNWCGQTGQRSSHSIRGVEPMMTSVFLALCHYIDINMSLRSTRQNSGLRLSLVFTLQNKKTFHLNNWLTHIFLVRIRERDMQQH